MKWKRTGCFFLAVMVWVAGISASASNIKSIQNQKSQNEKELQNIQSQISGLEGKRNALNSEVSGLNDELLETMLGIEVLQSDLEAKEEEIKEAEIAYEEAKETEERQYEAMKLRIQYLYESGTSSYMELLLTSDSVADLMNKVDYTEELQEYDNRLLDEYKAAKQAVIDLQIQLEDEREELMEMEAQMEEQKAYLVNMISRKRSEIANFDSQLSAARAKVSEYQKKIQEQTAQIKKLQEEAAKAAAAAAAAKAAKNNQNSSSSGTGGGSSSGGNSSSGTSSSGNSSSGSSDSNSSSGSSGSSSSSGSSGSSSSSGSSGLGGSIAAYGQQFIGNPYVYGGNSLTSGTDCSGFVNLVYAHFGISVPRQSGSLAVGGKAVSDADKQPGDVVCYYGHVGIYIGGGMIVHASSEKEGIRISRMTYQTVRAIRRYW